MCCGHPPTKLLLLFTITVGNLIHNYKRYAVKYETFTTRYGARMIHGIRYRVAMMHKFTQFYKILMGIVTNFKNLIDQRLPILNTYITFIVCNCI